jgi:CubicO group peptidase (beta-lactamase class C family)
MPMMRTLLVIAALSLTLQPPANAARDALDAFLRARVAAGDAPAVLAMVVNRDSTIYTGAFGTANVALKRPVTPDSLFRIASMTKPLTSLAAMMLFQQGRLGLGDPVTKYLPEFSKVRVITAWHESDATYASRPPSRMITVRDLLTHTSGLAYSFGDARLAKLDDGRSKETDLPLLHDPGAKFTYGPSTAVLGRIVETISGQTLDAFFKTRIFDPLGMHDTFYSVPGDKRDRVVTVQVRGSDGSLRETPNPEVLASPVRGDGGVLDRRRLRAVHAADAEPRPPRGRAGVERADGRDDDLEPDWSAHHRRAAERQSGVLPSVSHRRWQGHVRSRISDRRAPGCAWPAVSGKPQLGWGAQHPLLDRSAAFHRCGRADSGAPVLRRARSRRPARL